MPRRTTAHLFSSVNGVVESPDKFQFDAFGPEEGELMAESLDGVTDVVIGRKLWQEWSEYWPGADDPFGAFINPVRKHVVTSTLDSDGNSLGWNSTVITGDPVEYVRALQQDGSGGITVAGGIETIRSLFLAGVVDALTLTVHPAVTNEGRRLFDESVPMTRLDLVDSRITGQGNAVLTYTLHD
ncbi:dihydrofolate reductase [Rhodococcus sp. HNM0563]|uniref:dihydrofolate reductase family protein n=1 Tax=unclassified Rhodococcus (in: high G+C Gram-positive bacteria) TaxID=192944 RepID=UPI00146CE919|nr:MULTISPECIES: dihydrofolate reductase family protein [unclassified Rhodococcus (in: high G+C Gram-positive bacteria)]MCK0092449.1 dihydrofolate reductase family protein [Rhodococcus sp. F64268]NLU63196.1 dihydrofolate reductase [Rhodococcus sp. HNM0563]